MVLSEFSVRGSYGLQSPQARDGGVKKRKANEELDDNRIKDIRKRPRGTTPVSGAGAPQQSGGAFSSLSTAPTAGFSAPPAQSTGFNFGQTQSFPGASSTPTQSSQANSTPFSFGGGSQPGFNFSGGFGSSSSAPAANPFATGSSFSAGSFGTGDSTSSQPAQQNTPFSFGGFGSNQSTTQQPSFASTPFGAQPASTATGTGLFGQPATNNAGTNSVADSMQTSPDSKPKAPAGNTSPSLPSAPSLNRSLFGDSGSSTPLFGAATPASQPEKSNTASSTAPNIFSATKAAAPVSSSNPFAGLGASSASEKPSSPFSFTPAASKPAEPEAVNGTQKAPLFGAATPSGSQPEKVNTNPSTAPSLFGATMAATPVPSGNLFAGLGASSTAEKPSQPDGFKSTSTSAPNLFSATKTAAPASSSNPFAGLGASSTTEKPSSPFSFTPAASKPAEPEANETQKAPLFGASTPASQPETVKTTPFTAPNIFSNTKATTPASSGNLFAGLSASSTAEKPSQPDGSKSTPTKAPNLFSAANTAAPTPSGNPFAGLSASTIAEKPSSPFSFTPAASKSAEPEAVNGTQKAPLFGAATPSGSQPEKVNTTPSTASNLFSATNTAAPAPSGNPFAGLSASSTTEKPSAPLSFTPATSKPEKVNGNPSPVTGSAHEMSGQKPIAGRNTTTSNDVRGQFPTPDFGDDLTQELKDKAEVLWKIRTLDMHFQQQIAKVKPGETSFDNILLFYMKVRKSLGEPVKKRDNESWSSEKTPTQNGQSKVPVTNGVNGSATSNIFAKSFSSPKPTPPELENGSLQSASTKLGGAPASPAPSLFGGASSPAPPKFGGASSSPAPSLFGGASSPAPPKSGDASSSPAPPLFGGASSPAPPKFGGASSSPAPPLFGGPSSSAPPKFGNATSGPVDFMAQFKKTAESTAAKEKAKRKAEEFDSEEDDEEEWERRDAEKQREKLAKFAADAGKAETAKAVWVPGQGFKPAESAKSATPTPAESPAPSSSASIFESSLVPLSDSENIFGRISTPKILENDKDSDESDSGDKTTSPKPRAEDDTAGNALRDSKQAKSSDQTWKPTQPIQFGVSQTPLKPAAETTEKSNSEANDDESAPGAIFSLAEDAAETEGEECVFKCRARAFKLGTGWVSQGTGFASLLVHESGRARIVIRADPSGSVILNSLLKKEFDYQLSNNSVQFMVPRADGPPEHWAVRVKADAIKGFHEKVEAIKY
ncbi:uncharacterized protein N7484_006953 [Penicillium longicatenatum]|uniref:uncharacterized protein n=1 Tax=Penicillium longicatenatum TaxID=1561947 RepID=UPI002547D370|nr:uncharacterized protein N7484_006953 [Penicillium longicatenatum]KAJ5639091.1 hypothetical protein N7484_006953 [Penicillium longicatenatum]